MAETTLNRPIGVAALVAFILAILSPFYFSNFSIPLIALGLALQEAQILLE